MQPKIRSVPYLGMIALFLAPSAGHTAGQKSEIRYRAPADWVQPPPPPTDAATPADAPLRFIYSDTQVHIGPLGVETYSAYRARILKPEALQMGNVGIVWNPNSGDATVHYVRLIRGGQVIDVLRTTRFQVIQREGGLEQSILNGDLTAMLQVPGLQVGDELEVATTVNGRDPTLGDHRFGLFQFPPQGLPGAFRYRLSWPDADKLSFKSSRDLAVAVPAHDGKERTISYELRDPRGAILNDAAPARFNVRRLIEYSDFSDWADVSSRFWPLFTDAAKLSANAPLRAQIARIKAASSDPATRAEAALQLVQDEVRYVYVGLDGGNYRPASADITWDRRFGDCKAKTALLLAILRELGIEAEAVLVNVGGDDGLDGRLPNASVFNHVLVRATIAGHHYWLDGTRLGDRYLDMLPQPAFSWGLPVRQTGAKLEPVTIAPFGRPQFIGVMEMDARKGFDQPAKISLKYVIRGDEAYGIRSSLSSLSSEDADRGLRAYWRQLEGWVDADSADWKYDERHKTMTLSLVGTAKPKWDGDDKDGHDLTIWGAGFNPPDTLRRPKEQDASAPWTTDFPRFKCWAATIRLPAAGPKLKWDYYADAMNRQIGGVTYWRKAGLQGGVMRTVMSRSVTMREISSEQARAQTDAIPGFNNNMSSVYEAAAKTSRDVSTADEALPFGDNIDWAADDDACVAKEGK